MAAGPRRLVAAALVARLGAASPAPVATATLRAYYSFDCDANNCSYSNNGEARLISFVDESGNGFDGPKYNGEWDLGWFGYGPYYLRAGPDGKFTAAGPSSGDTWGFPVLKASGLTYAIDGDSPRSVCVWAEIDTFRNRAAFFEYGSDVSRHEDAREWFALRAGEVPGTVVVDFGKTDYQLDIPDSASGWHHYCLTYDGTSFYLFFDGSEMLTARETLATQQSDFSLGYFMNETTDSPQEVRFAGGLDELYVYTSALAKDDVRALYLSGCNCSDPAAWASPTSVPTTAAPTKITAWTERTVDGSTRPWAAVAVAADNADVLAAVEGGSGNTGNVWTSTNAGASWTKHNVGGSKRDWRGVAMTSVGNVIVAVSNGEGMWRWTLATDAWTEVDVGDGTEKWRDVAMNLHGDVIVAVAKNGRIWVSGGEALGANGLLGDDEDAVSTWTRYATSDTMTSPFVSATSTCCRWWRAVAVNDEGRYMVAAEYNGKLWLSTNFGVTWDKDDTVGSKQAWVDLAMSSNGVVVLGAVSGGKLWMSTTWPREFDTGSGLGKRDWSGVAVKAYDVGTIRLAAVEYGGDLCHSGDGGAAWSCYAPASGSTAADSAGDARMWAKVALSGDAWDDGLFAAEQDGNLWILGNENYDLGAADDDDAAGTEGGAAVFALVGVAGLLVVGGAAFAAYLALAKPSGASKPGQVQAAG